MGVENQGRKAGKRGLKIKLNICMTFGVIYLGLTLELGGFLVFPPGSFRLKGWLVWLLGGRMPQRRPPFFIPPAVFSPRFEAFSVIMGRTNCNAARRILQVK